MATPVRLPLQGKNGDECIILEWKKGEGDFIQEGDILCEVETDKAAFEIEAPLSGTVLRIFFDEGESAPEKTVIAVIGEPGEHLGSYNS